MRTWCAVVPFIGPRENFSEFLTSLNEEFLSGFCFVDNTPRSILRQFDLECRGAEVCYHPENLGCAASWNVGLKRGCDRTIILSTSIRFEGQFIPFMQDMWAISNDFGLLTNQAWHLIVLGRGAVDRIGLADESLGKYTCEDNDLMWRMHLAGIHGARPGTEAHLPKFMPHGVMCVGNAVALKCGAIKPEFQQVQDRYVKKWGGLPGQEKFLHPFNDASKPISWWPGCPE